MLMLSQKRTAAAGNLLLFVFFTLVFASCSKDKSSVATIDGVWQGTYGFGSSTGNYHYAFKIFENGTLQRLNAAGEVIGDGEWEMQNNIFMADFSVGDIDFSVIAAFDAAHGKMTGDWGYYPNVDEGRWQMTKTGN